MNRHKKKTDNPIDPAASTMPPPTHTARTSRQSQPDSSFANTLLFQTRIRESVSPYLPPPVIRGMQQFDATLKGYVGPEATLTLVLTFLVSYLIFKVLAFFTNRSGKAIQEDDDEPLAASEQQHYDATVLLCGPINAGKTRLFYQLTTYQSDVPTLMSVQANVAIKDVPVCTESDASKENTTTALKFIDWPGHAALDDSALDRIWSQQRQYKNNNARLVLVVDATQPVAAAADVLFQILTLTTGSSSSATRKQQQPTVFVACQKCDHPKAKTPKRIQLQLRGELERLLKVQASAAVQQHGTDTSDAVTFWKPNVPLDWSELAVKIQFYATSCCGANGEPTTLLLEYCATGALPNVE
jgi:signal recognition particle receptor subunit beta